MDDGNERKYEKVEGRRGGKSGYRRGRKVNRIENVYGGEWKIEG